MREGGFIMTIFYVLGVVVCIAVAVVGFLFYLMNKESSKPEKVSIVPINNPQEILRPAGPSLQEVEYKRRVDELENELRSISEKGVGQAQEAIVMIDTLSKENQILKEDKAKFEQDQNEKLSLMEHPLRQDNDALQVRLEESEAKLIQLQEEVIVIRKQAVEELAHAKASVEQSNSAQISSQSAARELAELKTENERLLQDVANLQINEQKFKESNDRLMEENQLLKYALIKNRAQISGLERICANYRNQIEKIYESPAK